MSAMMIFSHTPAWVWGLLVALLLLGLSQTRQRQVAPWRLWLLPAALSLWGLWSMRGNFQAVPLALPVWALCAGGAAHAVSSRQAAPGVRWLADAGRWQLPGSWLPLVVIVLIFCTRYASTVASVIVPGFGSLWKAQLPLMALLGGACGLLWGRSLQVLWVRTRARVGVQAQVQA